MKLGEIPARVEQFMHQVSDWLRGPEEAPVHQDVPRETMAWEGSKLTAGQAWDTMAIVCKYAGGKPLIPESFRGIDLPEGVSVDDAIECVKQFNAEQEKARHREMAARVERARDEIALKTVRARLKIAGKKLFRKDDSRRAKKKRLEKESRRRNR